MADEREVIDKMKVAAENGDITRLYELIKEDPNVLERIDTIPFVETPLHTAVSAGKIHFAVEVLRLKPSFGRKLNPNGLSSLHLALMEEEFDMVKRLIKLDKELIRVKGKEGETPLHFIAKKENNSAQEQQRVQGDQQRRMDARINILKEFLFACPDSMRDHTIRDENALHIAVKTKNTRAVEVIMGFNSRFNKKGVLANKDDEGNTALHIAVSNSQLEMVKLLIRGFGGNINEKNLEGKTALDIALLRETVEPKLMVNRLRSARAVESSSLANDHHLAKLLTSPELGLMVAAENGDIALLYESINEDPNVLERIDAIPFVETPLHIAASAGQIDFAIEIFRLKPSFGKKLNADGLSFLHLALIYEEFDVSEIKRLIKLDKELIRLKGKNGETPLHFIVKKEDIDQVNAAQQQREERHIDILAEFLFACPESIEDRTIRHETALHIAVKTKNIHAAKVILGFLQRINQTRMLAKKDHQGNTALHMAVSNSHLQMVEVLVKRFSRKDINKKNSRGETALDMALSLQTRDAELIEKRLRGAGALTGSSSANDGSSLSEYLSSREIRQEREYRGRFAPGSIGREGSKVRDAALVVAVLIATATFQALLTPPGGGSSGNNNLLTNASYVNATVSSTTNLIAPNTSFMNATLFIPTDDPANRLLFKDVQSLTYGKVLHIFYVLNTFAFVCSTATIMRFLPLKSFLFPLHSALCSLVVSYGISFLFISPPYGYSLTLTLLVVSLSYMLLVYSWAVIQRIDEAFQLNLFNLAFLESTRARLPVDKKRLQKLVRLMTNYGKNIK